MIALTVYCRKDHIAREKAWVKNWDRNWKFMATNYRDVSITVLVSVVCQVNLPEFLTWLNIFVVHLATLHSLWQYFFSRTMVITLLILFTRITLC